MFAMLRHHIDQEIYSKLTMYKNNVVTCYILIRHKSKLSWCLFLYRGSNAIACNASALEKLAYRTQTHKVEAEMPIKISSIFAFRLSPWLTKGRGLYVERAILDLQTWSNLLWSANFALLLPARPMSLVLTITVSVSTAQQLQVLYWRIGHPLYNTGPRPHVSK